MSRQRFGYELRVKAALDYTALELGAALKRAPC